MLIVRILNTPIGFLHSFGRWAFFNLITSYCVYKRECQRHHKWFAVARLLLLNSSVILYAIILARSQL